MKQKELVLKRPSSIVELYELLQEVFPIDERIDQIKFQYSKASNTWMELNNINDLPEEQFFLTVKPLETPAAGAIIEEKALIKRELLHEGTKSDIHIATYNFLDVAVKKVFNDTDFKREVSMLSYSFYTSDLICRKMKHPNIVVLLGVCVPVQILVLELMEMSLFDFVKNSQLSKQKYSEKALDYLRQTATGLHYLHDTVKVIHGSLKPTSILVLEKLFDN